MDCLGGYRAYVPAPLPPPMTWNASLTFELSSADRAIGRLAGEGRRLPNPHLLIRPFVRKEAVQSSRIEGTQATLGELLADEAGAAVERSPSDLREVGNYVVALEHGLARLESLPVSLRLVREMHDLLMRGVRGDMAAPGEFRRSQNWIGSPGSTLSQATYVPPPPAELMGCLDAWERFLHDETLPPLIHAAVTHAQFEAIHPFLDGNGRIGRLLITLLLVQRDIIPSPLLYLSSYFEATRQEYYARLLAVTDRGEWEEWLAYFPEGRRPAGPGRRGQDTAHGQSALRLEAAAVHRPVEGARKGARPACREPLLHGARSCEPAGHGVHHGSARHRPPGGGGLRHTRWGGAAQSGILRTSHPRRAGRASPPRELELPWNMIESKRVEPFSTFVVGSLPRPVWVRELILDRKAGRIDEASADRLLDAAIPTAVRLQERAGLDYLSDGEWRRESYTRVMSEAVDGFKNDLIPVGDPAPPDMAYPAVVSELRRRRSLAAGEVSFLRGQTDSKIIVALPSPYIIGWRMWSAEHSTPAYPTREEFMAACAEIIREEVRELSEMGVDAVQIDDPDMAMLVDPSYRERMGITDVDREIELSLRCVNGAAADAGDTLVSVHFCHSHFDRRHTTTGPYDLIMEALGEMDVDRFSMEFATPDAGGIDSLRRFPSDKTLGLGVVDHTDRHVETPEEIVERASRAMEHVPAERLTLNPDCGFSPSSLNPTDIDEAYLKLKALCAGARMLRERHG